MVNGLTVFRVVWTAFIVVVTSAPYLLNALSAPPGSHYTWIIPPYPDDSFAYAAWAQQAAHGAWLFKIKFTALPHHAFLFHPFFLVCGWMSALFSCDIGVVFWVAKAAGVVLFFTIFYRYIDYLRLDAVAWIAASILVGISSGFGGLVALLGWMRESPNFPADLRMPEMSTYWSLLWNPLFPFSLALLLLSIYWLDRASRGGSPIDFWRSGFVTGLLGLIHPYSIPLLFAFAAIATVARQQKRSLGCLAQYIGASIPLLFWVAWMSRSNPLVWQHSTLGEMYGPPVIALLLGFGLLLLLPVSALVLARMSFLRQHWQLLLWFLLSAALTYSPFWFQRKLIFGAHIALSILGGTAVSVISAHLSSRWRSHDAAVVSAIILAPLLLATPLYLYLSQREKVRLNMDGAYFVSEDLMVGLRALKSTSKPDDVVLATYGTSRLVAAFAGNTVVWGHWAMSIDLKQRRKWLQDLLSSESDWSDEKRSAAFWGNDIQFFFVDGAFKESIETDPLAWDVILRGAQKIFANNLVLIYRRPLSR